MKSVPISEAKAKLSALVDALSVSEEQITITKNGTPVAVLVSPSELEGWYETIAVKQDADLMNEIREGLSKMRPKAARLYTLDELFDT